MVANIVYKPPNKAIMENIPIPNDRSMPLIRNKGELVITLPSKLIISPQMLPPIREKPSKYFIFPP